MNSAPDDNFIDPEATDPKRQADELFIHGLMQQMHRDSGDARERRIQAVLDGIGAPVPAHAPFRFIAHFARVKPFVRIGSAAAAALLFVATLLYIGVSSEKTAEATVQATIAAMRSSGERRYEVRAKLETEKELSTEPIATIDTRAPDLLLLRSKGPDGHGITVGRDADGLWALRRDGSIERDDPETRWPRWAMLGDESLFADSVDQLLDTMSEAYDVKKGSATKLSGRGERLFTHISGTKKLQRPGPKTIDLWIDESSKVVEHMEMHFERPPQGQLPGGPGGPEGRGHLGRPLGPDGPPNGPNLPRDQEFRPHRPNGDGPIDHQGEHGPLGPPPNGPDGLDHPERPDGPPNGPPDGHRPHHPRDGEFGPEGNHPPPEGQVREGGPAPRDGHFIGDGEGPKGGPGQPGPRGHRPPFDRPDPRRGPRGERLPPLELLVIDRVDPKDFSNDYFNAATYEHTATTPQNGGAAPQPDGTKK